MTKKCYMFCVYETNDLDQFNLLLLYSIPMEETKKIATWGCELLSHGMGLNQTRFKIKKLMQNLKYPATVVLKMLVNK